MLEVLLVVHSLVPLQDTRTCTLRTHLCIAYGLGLFKLDEKTGKRTHLVFRLACTATLPNKMLHILRAMVFTAKEQTCGPR